jgi:2-keto-4-pentenoate hydratase/2-oxohepta-3-ene-1,7-dioic acid hydratase in catechol pathway
MRFANVGGRAALVSPEGRWVDVEEVTGGRVRADPMEALTRLEELRDARVPDDAPLLDSLTLGPPVPRPPKVLGAGINYFGHAREAGFDIPEQPLLFSKLPSAVCGPNDSVVIPAGRMQVDWEAELVIVIGRRGHRVSEADAWSHVAGLTAGQDISDREEQFRSLRQFTMGKSFDTYAPLGPMLVTLDEFPDPNDIRVRCWIDGEEVQDGRTADCIFTVAELIAWASQISTLEVGDLLFTGTPSGVGYIRDPARFLQAGQLLETEVDGIGRLKNRCIAGPEYVTRTYDRVEVVIDASDGA